MLNRGPSIFHLVVVWCLLMGSASTALAQCPGPYDNFPNFDRFNLTPTGVGDTMRANAVWGGDFHHINVDSGKTYVIDMCETVYIPDPGNMFFSPPDMVDFDPQITLVNDTLGDSLLFIMPSGVIVGHDDNSCGNAGNMPRIVYTSDFTGNLAVIVDPVTTAAGNNFGCDSFAIDSARIFVTEILLGIQGIITPTNVSCNGGADGAATVGVTGNVGPPSYLWSTGDTTASISGLGIGTYTVTVTDTIGNGDTVDVTITQPTALSATATATGNVSCNGFADGSATASGSGGSPPYSYLWSNGDTTASPTTLSAGTNTVSITDNNGCGPMTASVTITEPTAVVVTAVVDSSATGAANADGGATASASGGTMPYTYAWANGATTASITGVLPGTYTITVTDNNGCTGTDVTTIFAGPSATVSVDSTVSCFGFSDGGASATVVGGTMPYTYLWSNAATIASVTGVTTGTYTVTVTDAGGLTSSNSVFISEPTAINGTITSSTDISCNGGADGSITASASGGTGSYTYAWSNGTTAATNSGVMAGTYTVTVTDANGCTDVENETLTEPGAVTASTVVDSNVTCNGFLNGGATASGSGGTMPYTYVWSNAATTASITGVAAGTYTVSITDNNGCGPATSSVMITEPTAVAATSVVDSNVTCNGFMDGGATASGSGGTMP
ncbi:MAG: SprB repeat-containing protein, partial [Bacteroidota bacterium]